MQCGLRLYLLPDAHLAPMGELSFPVTPAPILDGEAGSAALSSNTIINNSERKTLVPLAVPCDNVAKQTSSANKSTTLHVRTRKGLTESLRQRLRLPVRSHAGLVTRLHTHRHCRRCWHLCRACGFERTSHRGRKGYTGACEAQRWWKSLSPVSGD